MLKFWRYKLPVLAKGAHKGNAGAKKAVVPLWTEDALESAADEASFAAILLSRPSGVWLWRDGACVGEVSLDWALGRGDCAEGKIGLGEGGLEEEGGCVEDCLCC